MAWYLIWTNLIPFNERFGCNWSSGSGEKKIKASKDYNDDAYDDYTDNRQQTNFDLRLKVSRPMVLQMLL